MLERVGTHFTYVGKLCPIIVPQAYRFTEFFAGEANVSSCMRQFGFAGLSFDVDYGGRYNNIFEPAGFACLEIFWHIISN